MKQSALLRLVKNGVMYFKLFMHRDTPWSVKAIVLAALLYLISPYDLLPDWILGIGIIDDFVLVSLLVGLAIKLLKKDASDKPDRTGGLG
ncbi:MAG: DUF1232 domain-containing protein [Desulfobacterales bacterium]|nr:DUF1232 domain-containing protein [Desulfobacterales bacterium]